MQRRGPLIAAHPGTLSAMNVCHRALAVALLGLAACPSRGSHVTVLPVVDEMAPALPTVAGGQALSFVTDDGVTIEGTYWPPTAPTASCVVFAHQLSSTRSEWVPVIERLHGRAHLYAIDLRGHGASIHTTAGDRGWQGFGDHDWQQLERDLAQASDVIAARGAGDRCVVVGASIGSSAVLRWAGSAPTRTSGVVALSPGLNYRGLSTPEAVRRIAAPVLIVHSQESGALDAATALANIVRDNHGAVTVIADPGIAHGMKIVAGDPTILDQVVDFIAKQLP
jgi:alpha-beta hydrolase superfamily lysophospholipase